MRLNPELIARHYVPDAALAGAPPIATVAEALAELRDAFSLLGDWTERYQYVIDLGKNLTPLPQEYCNEHHRLHGCQSTVWLVITASGGRLYMHATSDAIIVSGLIALVARVYNGRTPAEIMATEPGFIAELGLGEHLSPGRKNGLYALVEAIRTVAAHVQQQEAAA